MNKTKFAKQKYTDGENKEKENINEMINDIDDISKFDDKIIETTDRNN